MNNITHITQENRLLVEPTIRTEPRLLRTVQRKWWKVAVSWKITLHHEGGAHEIVIPAGFTYNGASIPFALRGIINTSEIFFAATIHDRLYNTAEYPRERADKIFRTAIVMLDKRPRWVAFAAWVMVRAFGKNNFNNALRRKFDKGEKV